MLIASWRVAKILKLMIKVTFSNFSHYVILINKTIITFAFTTMHFKQTILSSYLLPLGKGCLDPVI